MRRAAPVDLTLPDSGTDVPFTGNLKTVVSYVLYAPAGSTQDDHIQCLRNVEFFMSHGLLEDPALMYVFSLIGDTQAPYLVRRALLERPNNVRLRRAQLASSDQIAHAIVLRRYSLIAQTFMLINCGCKGPYFSGSTANETWLDPFRNKLSEEVKLVGPTINCELRPHVQSYAMMTDKVGASVLVKMWSHLTKHSHKDMIEHGEVAFSTLLLKSGWNIASLESRRANHDFRGLNSVCDPEFASLNNTMFANPTACRVPNSPGCHGLEPCEVIFVKNGGAILLHGMVAPSTRARLADEDQKSPGPVCTQGYVPVRPFIQLHDVYPKPVEKYDGVKLTVIIRAHALYFQQLLAFLHSLASIPQPGILALVIAMDAASQPVLHHAISHFMFPGPATNVKAHVLDFPSWIYTKHSQTMPELCSQRRKDELRSLLYPEEHIAKFCFIDSPLHYVLTDMALLYTLAHVRSSKHVMVTNADNSYSPLFYNALLSEENDKFDIITTNSILKGGILYVRPEKGQIDLGSYAVSPDFLRKTGVTFLSSLPWRPRADHYHDADGHFFVTLCKRGPLILNISAFYFYQV